MVGGVLQERTVKDVIPILIANEEQVRFLGFVVFSIRYVYVKMKYPEVCYLYTLQNKTSIKDWQSFRSICSSGLPYNPLESLKYYIFSRYILEILHFVNLSY
jgi:hypothetical protein